MVPDVINLRTGVILGQADGPVCRQVKFNKTTGGLEEHTKMMSLLDDEHASMVATRY